MKKRIYLLSVFVAIFFLSGCASQVYNTQYLKKPNKFAIVSVTGISSGFGLSEKEEIKLVTSTATVAYKELKRAKHFKLVPSSKIRKGKAYRSIKAESTSGLLTIKAAKGYKKFDPRNEKKALGKLMKRFKLTGAIFITASFTKKDSGLSLMGLLPVPVSISAGTTSGQVILHIVAVDVNSEVIWQDTVELVTEESVGNVMGLANLKSLYPQLISTAQMAANKAIENMNKKMM